MRNELKTLFVVTAIAVLLVAVSDLHEKWKKSRPEATPAEIEGLKDIRWPLPPVGGRPLSRL